MAPKVHRFSKVTYEIQQAPLYALTSSKQVECRVRGQHPESVMITTECLDTGPVGRKNNERN